MFSGVVDFPEARITLEVHGPRRLKREIEAIIDTGYTGALTLPLALIAALGLRWKGFRRGVLADGSECLLNVYVAKLIWDGRVRGILVDEADSDPLVGMELLYKHELKLQIRTGGKVKIVRLS
jgi:clan AA aspartic protease